MFPVEPSEPKQHVDDFIVLCYGDSGFGKSTFASELEDPLFLETEPGLKWLNVKKMKVDGWENFQEIIKALEVAAVNDKRPCRTVVVDTVDNLTRFCQAYVCAERGIDHPTDQDWGKGWDALFNEWHLWIVRLCSCGLGVWFIGHAKDKEVVSRSIKITKIMPAFSATFYRSLNALVDFIFYCGFRVVKSRKTGKKTERRYLFTKPSEQYDGKDRTGQLPERIPFRYAKFKEEFDKVTNL